MPMNLVIQERRKELGLTQEQVAEYLNVSIPAVSKWEKGTTSPAKPEQMIPVILSAMEKESLLQNSSEFQELITEYERFKGRNTNHKRHRLPE